jgi:hypothetical protein
MKTIVWFDPYAEKYKYGTAKEYEEVLNGFEEAERVEFSVMYELTELSAKLAPKLVSELNKNSTLLQTA